MHSNYSIYFFIATEYVKIVACRDKYVWTLQGNVTTV